MEPSTLNLIPLYSSKGDAEAFLHYPNIFNRTGDWVGFVNPKREVYSVIGHFVGFLTDDRRIVRKRFTSALKPRQKPPQPPAKIYPPATVALAPMMRDLTHGQIDVLLDEPERLHTLDSGELREDMD